MRRLPTRSNNAMTLPEYIQAAKRSEGDYRPTQDWCGGPRSMVPFNASRGHPVLPDYRILHAAMGLGTEAGELVEAMLKPMDSPLARTDRIEEIGDLAWYCAILMDAVGLYSVAPVEVDATTALWRLVMEAGAINDLVKRFLFYGAEFNLELCRERLGRVWNILRALAQGEGCSLETVLCRNVSKLMKRYPQKFTEAHALHRNLAAERLVLNPDSQPAQATGAMEPV